MILICKDCEKYMRLGAPAGEAGGKLGLCTLPGSYFPVQPGDPCAFLSCPELKCCNCSHFPEPGCAWAEPDDPACPGFADGAEDDLMQIFFTWAKRGKYSREKVLGLCSEFEGTEMYRFLQAHQADGSQESQR